MKRRVAVQSKDLDLTTFMNLMVVLIPVLLASVEFSKIAIIEANLEKDRLGSGSLFKAEDSTGLLKATVLTSDSTVTVGFASGLFETIHLKKGSQSSYDTVIAVDPTGKTISALYEHISGTLITDSTGKALETVKLGQRIWINGESPIHYNDSMLCESKPLKAMDQVTSHLRALRLSSPKASDRDNVVIGSDTSVVYDLLVQCMDAAENGGFENLAFAKINK